MVFAVVAIVAGAGIFVATREVTPIDGTNIGVTLKSFKSPSKNYKLDEGLMAVGTVSEGLKFMTGEDKAYPIASVAKVITALVVLEEKSIEKDGGPKIPILSDDVARWFKTVNENGTNLKVNEGQQITLRQMLEGIILSSANNLADSLAIWAFGSFDKYHTAATDWLAKNGLDGTKIGTDASGLDPGTVSTAKDLITIGSLVMKNETLREIVGQKTAIFPEIGEITNQNRLLGENGFVGIKTGTTEEAGYCLLFANDYKGEIIIGVVLGQKDNNARYTEAERAFDFAKNQTETLVLPAGSVVGRYNLPWGLSVKIVSASEIKTLVWFGNELTSKVKIDPIDSAKQAGDKVGEITFGNQKSDLILDDDIKMPDVFWKISNINQLKF